MMNKKNNSTYKTVRVQGSDKDLTETLNEVDKDGWKLVQILGNTSSNSAAENNWLVILRNSHGG